MPGAVLSSNLETAVVVVTGEAVPLAFEVHSHTMELSADFSNLGILRV